MGKGFYDAFAIDTLWSFDMALAGYLENLDSYATNDAKLDWTDFFACVCGLLPACVEDDHLLVPWLPGKKTQPCVCRPSAPVFLDSLRCTPASVRLWVPALCVLLVFGCYGKPHCGLAGGCVSSACMSLSAPLHGCRFMRSSSALFNGSIIGLPVSGHLPQMYYRRDVLARAGLAPPDTWQELLAAARLLNGTDMNGGQHLFRATLAHPHVPKATPSLGLRLINLA